MGTPGILLSCGRKKSKFLSEDLVPGNENADEVDGYRSF